MHLVRFLALTLVGLVACNDTGFSQRTPSGGGTIEGAGELALDQDSLLWTDLDPGITIGQTLLLHNVGELNLVLYEARVIDSGGGVFFVPETRDKVIGPGGTYELVVTATLSGDQPANGTLRIKTNDVAALERSLALRGEPAGWTQDTGGADTGPVDTGPVDTGAADTGAADTGGADTAGP